jgi:hypothetical protein
MPHHISILTFLSLNFEETPVISSIKNISLFGKYMKQTQHLRFDEGSYSVSNAG